MTNRTKAYRFTVQMKDGKPVPEQAHFVDALRKVVSAENTWNTVRKYVKLQGRGPRKVNNRKYFQSLPLNYATHADVYVYIR